MSDFLERLTREEIKARAALRRAEVLSELNDHMHSNPYLFDHRGDPIDPPEEVKKRAVRHLGQMLLDTLEAERRGRIDSMESTARIDAINQVMQDIPLRRSLGRKIKDAFDPDISAEDWERTR